MENDDKHNSKIIKKFISGILMLVGLFMILAFGFATFIQYTEGLGFKCIVLICVLMLIPIGVFFMIFCCLIKPLCEKSSASSNPISINIKAKEENNGNDYSLVIDSNTIKQEKELYSLLEKIHEQYSKKSQTSWLKTLLCRLLS